ncbi:hypothetical protein MTR67_048331 [Solanum verrucosum]|uniref:Uncharacterized protein n=1 Tax=Solanum verrucosum TaxID=315347 RepID=A0AAF0ZX98_SOLVR|nr:hypothetical protein MTR67_048331 [Solanum verrucosum]
MDLWYIVILRELGRDVCL